MVRVAEVGEVDALALAVADLAADGQRLGMVHDRGRVLAERVVRVAEVAEEDTFAPPVADLDARQLRLSKEHP